MGHQTAESPHSKTDTILTSLITQLKTNKHEISGILITQNQQTILEEYFNGHTKNQSTDLRSITKSITSILAGITIDKGYIKNINTPITTCLPEKYSEKWKNQEKEEITIKHLLTMSTGLECNDWDRNSQG